MKLLNKYTLVDLYDSRYQQERFKAGVGVICPLAIFCGRELDKSDKRDG